MDSNCDTTSVGKGAFIVEETEQTVSVNPFLPKLGKVHDVPIVTAALAYDCKLTHATYILYFHQALYFKTMERHLICPNQLRAHNVKVNDIPLVYTADEDRQPEHHLIATNPPDLELHIPLQIEGVTSYFEV